MSVLEVRGVSRSFGGVTALADLHLAINEGEIVGLIGPNGSGKTTLFHVIAGALAPDRGDISYRGESLIGLTPDAVCQRGVGRTFQLARVFPALTALENVLAGQPHHGERILTAFAGASTRAVRERAQELLEFVGLGAQGDELARELSYGQQRLLELAAVLMGEPRLILLDEPTAGINPALVERLLDGLREINRRGVTIVLIEHNMEAVMGLSKRMYALAQGRKIAEGSPDHVRNDPAVLEAYFGAARVRHRP
jgi:ABC-type branched-subunit amino acid transport system ATPase component